MKAGDKVRYLGCSEDQANWGNYDDPRKYLTKGETYEIIAIDIHKFHTKITLAGHDRLQFNSVVFEPEIVAEQPGPVQPTTGQLMAALAAKIEEQTDINYPRLKPAGL